MDNKKLSAYVVSLDDLGMSSKRDEIALALVRKGNIDRVSIVVSISDCAHLKRELSDLSVKKDIHLNVTEKGEYNNIYEPGFFQSVCGRIGFLFRLYLEKNMAITIAQEWETQIERFHTIFGVYPDGINTHEHIHLIPSLFPKAITLASKFGIGYIRIGERPSVITTDHRVKVLNFWHTKNIKQFASNKIKTSVTLHSFNWAELSLEEIIKCIPPGSELVFHPQYEKDISFLEELG